MGHVLAVSSGIVLPESTSISKGCSQGAWHSCPVTSIATLYPAGHTLLLLGTATGSSCPCLSLGQRVPVFGAVGAPQDSALPPVIAAVTVEWQVGG